MSADTSSNLSVDFTVKLDDGTIVDAVADFSDLRAGDHGAWRSNLRVVVLEPADWKYKLTQKQARELLEKLILGDVYNDD